MPSLDTHTAEPLLVRSGRQVRCLIALIRPDESRTFLLEDDLVVWTTSVSDALAVARAAGATVVEPWNEEHLAVFELDQLQHRVSNRIKPEIQDEILQAWAFYDDLANTMGEEVVGNRKLRSRLLSTSGTNESPLLRKLARVLRRSGWWNQAQVESLRQVLKTGLNLLRRSLADQPTTATPPAV